MKNQICAEEWLLDLEPEVPGKQLSSCVESRPRPGTSLRFDDVYEAWFDEVVRWVRVMGAPSAEQEDLVQEVFMVVHRRLHSFDGKNLAGWLYQIARHKTRDFNRLRWVKHFMRRRSPLPEGLAVVDLGPAESLAAKQKAEALAAFLKRLSPDERSALFLFEVEGYSGERIADMQRVNINTIWGRLYSARKKLRAQLSRMETGWLALS